MACRASARGRLATAGSATKFAPGRSRMSANIYSKEQRLVPEWIGWLVLMLGMFGAFVHPAVENDRLLRQLIGGAAVTAIVIGLGLASFRSSKWPVGLIPFIPGLLLLILFA